MVLSAPSFSLHLVGKSDMHLSMKTVSQVFAVLVTKAVEADTFATCAAFPSFEPVPVKAVAVMPVLIADSVKRASALVFEDEDVLPTN